MSSQILLVPDKGEAAHVGDDDRTVGLSCVRNVLVQTFRCEEALVCFLYLKLNIFGIWGNNLRTSPWPLESCDGHFLTCHSLKSK